MEQYDLLFRVPPQEGTPSVRDKVGQSLLGIKTYSFLSIFTVIFLDSTYKNLEKVVGIPSYRLCLRSCILGKDQTIL